MAETSSHFRHAEAITTAPTVNEWVQLFENPPEEFVAFMQLWRYFARAASVFHFEDGSPLRVEDLTTRNAKGERVVSTLKIVIDNNPVVITKPK
jgi:hypothetical protein